MTSLLGPGRSGAGAVGREASQPMGLLRDWAGILWEKELCSVFSEIEKEVVLVQQGGAGGPAQLLGFKSQFHHLLLHPLLQVTSTPWASVFSVLRWGY